MGIFNKGIFNGLFDMDEPFWKKPSIIDTVVEEEGKKAGYSRAAEEYGKAFKFIESEYKWVKELIELQKNMYDMQSDALIEKLEALENQKDRFQNRVEQKNKDVYDVQIDALIRKMKVLENEKRRLQYQTEQKIKEVSEKYGISVSQLQRAFITGNIIEFVLITLIQTKSILIDKIKKYIVAELIGYLEAKKIYEEKIGKLTKELEELRRKGSAEIQEMSNMIIEILDAIADEQMKIAELKILL